MGIIALFDGDQSGISSGATIDVTDTKYFYTDTGANTYEIYRGPNQVEDNGGVPATRTITVTKINATSIVITWTGGETISFLSSDEIWISSTYDGSKIFRWVNNPSITGGDIKQYDTFKLSGGENDAITMLTNIGNVQLIANKSSMASWNDYILENFDLDLGCVSEKGYVKLSGILYFLHYTGVYATSGGLPRLISNKIEPYITGATKAGKEASAAGKKGRSVFFTLGDVTLYHEDGSEKKVLSDVCLEYNTVQENWFVHTNVCASEFVTFVEESDSDKLEFTDTGGNYAVKEFLTGSTDNGTEINFRVDTHKLTLQPTAFELSSKPTSLIVETERGASLKAYVSINKTEEFYPLEGKIVKGLSVLKIHGKDEERSKPPTCRQIKISLRDSSAQICKISKISILHIPTNEEISDNQN